MRQPNGGSTPAPKSSAAKQWIKELAQTKEEEANNFSLKLMHYVFHHKLSITIAFFRIKCIL